MPYIPQDIRDKLTPRLDSLFAEAASSGTLRGNLDFCITYLLHKFIAAYCNTDNNQVCRKGLCYDALNDAVGVVECCKQELFRSIVNPYEKGKQQTNGVVGVLTQEEFFANVDKSK